LSLLHKRICRNLLSLVFIGLLVANVFWFAVTIEPVSASPELTLKWTRNLGVDARTLVGPLAADLVGDDRLEIVVTGGSAVAASDGTVTVLNGTTGAIIWQVAPGGVGAKSPFDIADINSDGNLEIIVSGNHPVVLHGNDGSIYWERSDVSSYNLWSAVCDIDADGYSEIFVSSGWGPWQGYDYFTMLSYDGEILRQNPTSWHPCWGGVSIGDANFDGRFELYQGDRCYGYDTSTPYIYGEWGVRALDAHTLTPLWNDDDITCSSHCPILADVDKDGILDVIATDQGTSNGGLIVLNAADGSVLTTGGKYRKSSSLGLPSHSQPTVYDIDGDGNLEIITCRNTVPKIWDLYDWKLDATLPHVCEEPPKVGDVTGDGEMDIIVVSGSSIYIYDKNYNQVDYVTGPAGARAFTLVQDVDGDGDNELVVSSYAGRVYCYDTPAPAPTPRVRSELQFYSEYKRGAAEYVPPPGPQAPTVADPSPLNGEIDVPVTLSQLSFTLVDFQSDLMSYTVTTSPNIGSGSGTNVGNGRYSVAISNLEYGKTYTWQVDVTDGANWAHETFTFATKDLPPWWDTQWQYRKTINIDPSQVSGDQTDFPVLIDMTDTDLKDKAQLDGDDILFADQNNVKLSHEIEQYDSATGHLVAWVRIPFVSSTSFTTFYMYYGNPTAPNQEDPAAVWDTSYKLVLHLSEEHECRMWAMISDSGLPHDTVVSHLITDPDSLEDLSSGNVDGWGMVWYAGTDFEERRGEPPAYTDPNYRPAANELADSGATIGVAHVRAASAGTPKDIPDPHPFTRDLAGKTWSLAHNGYISKPALKTLINARDPNYLSENPPNVGDWNVENSYVDSDLYMAYIMLCIEQSNWDVLTGLALVLSTVPSGSGNIILTDGTTIWAFANGQTLTYYYQATSPTYSVVASQKPDPAQAGWTSMSAYNLVILTRNNAPILISDIRQYRLLVDATFDDSADSTALRADGTGQDWYESRGGTTGGDSNLLFLDTSNIGGNMGNKAGFTASSSGNAYVTQEFGAPQTGTFSVQWDIYVDSILHISEADRAGWMLIGDNSVTGGTGGSYNTPNNPPSERFVYMAFAHEGGATEGTMDLVAKTIAEGFDAHTVIASDLNLKQWYTIKVVCDVPGKTYDIYVNDVLMDTFVTDFAGDNVTHISFAQWDDGAGAFYVDNVYAPAIDTYTIVASAGVGGSIDPVGDVVVAEGSDQLFTITADTDYEILDVLVDGVSVGVVTTYTFEDVATDHTITASFRFLSP
jgi:predicted glutamine amidotransferase